MRKIPSLRQIIRDEQARNARGKAAPAVPNRPAGMGGGVVIPAPLPIVNTDSLPEGVTNLYFTDARAYAFVKGALLEGTNVTITADDENLTLTLTVTAGDVAASTHAAEEKVTPADNDEIPLTDSENSFSLKKILWGTLVTVLSGIFDLLYAAIDHLHTDVYEPVIDQNVNSAGTPSFAGMTLTAAITHAAAAAADITLRTNSSGANDGFVEYHMINYGGGVGETVDYIVWEKTDYNHAVPDGGFVYIGTGTGGTVEWLRLSADGVQPTNGLLSPAGVAPTASQYYGTDSGGTQGYHDLPAGGDPAAAIHAADEKTTPADADEFGIADSAASYALKRLTWANVKTAMQAFMETLFPRMSTAAVIYVVATDGDDGDSGLATAITGTVSVSAASATVEGVGTSFTTELTAGEYIVVNNEARKIDSITDNDTLTTTTNYEATANTQACYKCAAPKLTVQGAVNALPPVVNHACTICLAPGTYSESVTMDGFTGESTIVLRGAKSTTNTHTITGLDVRFCTSPIWITGLNFSGTNTDNLRVRSSSYVLIQLCNMVASGSGVGIWAYNGSTAYMSSGTISNRSVAVQASDNGMVTVGGLSGSSNTTVLKVYNGGTLNKINATVPSGTAAESIASGGLLVRSSGYGLGTS